MPTYEYECGGCGHRFDVFQSIVAPPLKKCPECGKRLKRLIGAGAGVIFKDNKKEAPGACQGCPSAGSCPTAAK